LAVSKPSQFIRSECPDLKVSQQSEHIGKCTKLLRCDGSAITATIMKVLVDMSRFETQSSKIIFGSILTGSLSVI
jgi:hypothetical protein